jgi:hypothetical protein
MQAHSADQAIRAAYNFTRSAVHLGTQRLWIGRFDDVRQVEIAFELRGRDAADCAYRRQVRHHSLIDDNPASG